MTREEVADIVFAAKPIFKRIIDTHGTKSLFAYYKNHRHSPRLLPAQRMEELVSEVAAMTAEILGPVVAQKVRAQLERDYTVSTANHHDFLTHPFFAHCTLARSAALQADEALISLTCGGVSMNNSSFPRGLMLHDSTGAEHHLSLISLKNHHHPVYGKESFTAVDLSRVLTQARSLSLLPPQAEALERTLTSVLNQPAIIAHQTLSEQITAAVYALWRLVPGMEQKHVVSIEQETLVSRLLQKYHLTQDTIIQAILFEEDLRAAFLKNFDGIQGAHNHAQERGTELFWGITKKGRVALRVHQGALVGAATDFTLPLTPGAVQEALREGRLMPSMALTYCVLSFYYGVVAGGGFSQVNYLTSMKEAYLKLLAATPRYATEALHLPEVETDHFTGEFHLVFGRTSGRIIPVTPLDLIVRGTPAAAPAIQASCQELSLAEAVAPMLPELYKIITGKPALLTLESVPTKHRIIDL
jgi:hypothetical protein